MFDNGRSATQGGFNAMGAPLPDITAVIVTFLELIGGLTLILGVSDSDRRRTPRHRHARCLLHHAHGDGFFAPTGGYELVVLLGATAFALVLTGPGMFALDLLINLPRKAQSGLSLRQPRRG